MELDTKEMQQTGNYVNEAAGVAAEPAAQSILIVDDNQDAADSLGALLGLMGNEVHIAYDGEQALEMAAALEPRVVLMDIGLPKLNGYEAARRMRALPGLRDALIVALTGWGQGEDRRRSREAGFDHHLVKPVALDDLQNVLAQPAGRQII
jgi:CheY-like chemotaxis protein